MANHRRISAEAPRDRQLYDTVVVREQAQVSRDAGVFFAETLDGSARYMFAAGPKNISVHGLEGTKASKTTPKHARRETPDESMVVGASWPRTAGVAEITENVTTGTDHVPIHEYATVDPDQGRHIGKIAMVEAPDALIFTFPEPMRFYREHIADTPELDDYLSDSHNLLDA